MPTSRTLISSGQILLGINWLAEGNYKFKFKKFYNNKPALAIVLIYLLYVAGLLWTENLSHGIGYDLKNKLPILTLTFIIATSQSLDIKKLRVLLFLFIATVLTVSFIGLYFYLTDEQAGFRDLTPYASHLYFSMMLIVSAFMLPWLTRQITDNKVWLIISFVISAWMVFFIFLSRSLSGLTSLAGVLTFLLIWIVLHYKSIIFRVTSVIIFVGSIIFTAWLIIYIYSLTTHKVETDFSSLELYTDHGNAYMHDTTNTLRENGNLVYIYLAEEELKPAWNEASPIDYYGKDLKNHEIRHTLFRYMASKGYRKDRKHFDLMTDSDIDAIERGLTNYQYKDWPGIFTRIHQTMMGVQIYLDTNDPSWSTLAQRIDLWKASFQAFKKKPILGWGTGDIYTAVQYGLEKNNSKQSDQKMKPHNQYILFALSLGSAGLLLIFMFYIYTLIQTKANKFLPFNVFLVAFLVNMLGNNPIDAQYGLTMFIFFTSFFCFMYPVNNNSQPPGSFHNKNQ